MKELTIWKCAWLSIMWKHGLWKHLQMTVIQHCKSRSHCLPKKGPFASSFYLSYKCDYLKDSLLVDTFEKEKDNSLVKYTLDTRLLNYCGKIWKKCRPDPFWGSSAKGHWKQLFCGPRILQRALVPKKGHFLRPTKGLCWCISIQHCPFVPFWLKSGPQRELVSKQNGWRWTIEDSATLRCSWTSLREGGKRQFLQRSLLWRARRGREGLWRVLWSTSAAAPPWGGHEGAADPPNYFMQHPPPLPSPSPASPPAKDLPEYW